MPLPYIPLETVAMTDQLLQESRQHPEQNYIIFKNSTQCSVSRMSMRLFESEWNPAFPVYLVQVIENRAASNALEQALGVRHESPQVLLVRNGRAVYHASHHEIDAGEVLSHMQGVSKP